MGSGNEQSKQGEWGTGFMLPILGEPLTGTGRILKLMDLLN
jgi:hypothetical protein